MKQLFPATSAFTATPETIGSVNRLAGARCSQSAAIIAILALTAILSATATPTLAAGPNTLAPVPFATPITNGNLNDNPMVKIVEHYVEDRRALERLYNISFSPNRADRLERLYDEQLTALNKMDFEALDQDGRIDWLLFRNHLQFEQRELAYARKKADQISSLLPFASSIIELEENRRRLQSQEPRESANLVASIPDMIEKAELNIKQQLEKGIAADAVIGRRAAMAVDELRRSLRNWNGFYADYHPSFTWWLKAPYQDADKALEDYAWFLREKLAGFRKGEDEPVIGDPIGREALLGYLRAEMIPYTPEELIEIA